MKNPYAFEYNAIKEDLEELDNLTPARAMELQTRLCELRLYMKEHQEKIAKNRKEVFRNNPVKDSKRVTEADMTDLRAFKHMLTDREICKQYKVSTLTRWRTLINKGQLPSNFHKYLKENGYRVQQKRIWKKPNARK
jgi:DNA-binding LytR/AlgR family response regulator